MQFNYQAEPYKRKEFDTLPDGIYKVEIANVAIKSDEFNSSFAFQFEVLEPFSYAGRIIFQNILTKYQGVRFQDMANAAEKIQLVLRIAKNKLNGILEMIKMKQFTDTNELIGKKLQVKIKSKPDKKNPSIMRTDIIDFFDYFYTKPTTDAILVNPVEISESAKEFERIKKFLNVPF